MSTPDPLGPPVTSGASSLEPTTVEESSICVAGECFSSAAPVSGANTGETDPVGLRPSTTESNAAISTSTRQPAEESKHPNSDITREAVTTVFKTSQSSYPTSSHSATLVVTNDPSPTAATSLQTDGAGPKDGNSGLSAGAVAGIAIATLIAGAVIAFVAAFFLFKRRNRTKEGNVANKDYNNYADSTPDFVMMQQQNNIGRSSPYVPVSQTPTPRPAILPTPLPASAQQCQGVDITGCLPHVAPEGKVYNRAMELFNQCHSHIETYYRDVHASITPSMEPELAQFGAKGVNMAELLQDCSSPTTALKHAVVAHVLGITAPRSDHSGETIFPDELRGIYSREDHGGSIDSNVTAASTLHRRLSVYLFNAASPTTLSRRGLLTDSNAHEAAEHFSLTFFPWANPSANDQDRDEALAGLIHMALRLNIWLYSEPFLYEFEWEETGRRGVLVSPSLVRRTDGSESHDKKVIVEGVVMAA